ncbi:MAG: hypothetical protein MZW92_37680 [Comamonadaceae bacterium]|nr:hypothetical protein [Comamonadaceae bacterium]
MLPLTHHEERETRPAETGLAEFLDQQHRPWPKHCWQRPTAKLDPQTLWQRVFGRLDDPAHKELAARLLMADQHLAGMDDWRHAFDDRRQRLQQSGGIKESKQVVRQLGTMSSDHPDYQQLLVRANELRKQKSEIQ